MDNDNSKKAMELFLLEVQRKNAEKSDDPVARAVAPKTVRDAIAEFVAVKPILPKR